MKARQLEPLLCAVLRKIAAEAESRVECPECGHKGPHDDNGRDPRSESFSLCCVGCGMHWDPNDAG